jgi:hypothetical protein
MTFAIIRNSDLAVLKIYQSDVALDDSAHWSWLWCSPQATHVQVDDGALIETLTASRDDAGVISAAIDQTKVAAKAASDLANAWAAMRNQRNALLSACDWTQMADSPCSPQLKSNWATYRQALRDLPGSVQDPSQIVWPSPPGPNEQ